MCYINKIPYDILAIILEMIHKNKILTKRFNDISVVCKQWRTLCRINGQLIDLDSFFHRAETLRMKPDVIEHCMDYLNYIYPSLEDLTFGKATVNNSIYSKNSIYLIDQLDRITNVHLDITGINLSEFELFCSTLKTKKSIKSIYIKNCLSSSFLGVVIDLLRQLPSVGLLSFFNLHMESDSDHQLLHSYLNQNRTISKLEIAFSSFTSLDFIKETGIMVSNRSIEYLDLSFNPNASSSSVDSLIRSLTTNQSHRVNYLNLSGLNLSNESIRLLGTLLESNTTIQTLVLNDGLKTWESGFVHFSNSLSANSTLLSLSLNRNRINSQSFSSLVSTLTSPNNQCKIQTLLLSGTLVDQQSISTLDSLLSHNNTLLHLDLSNCDFSNSNNTKLLQDLSQNQTLTELNLANTNLSDTQLQTLTQSLLVNLESTRLVSLNLGYNHNTLTSPILIEFIQSLKNNQTLSTLSIESCNIKKKECQALSTLLEINTQLSTLDLSSNHKLDKSSLSPILKSIQNYQPLQIEPQESEKIIALFNDLAVTVKNTKIVDRDGFKRFHILSEPLSDRLFNLFDQKKTGMMTLDDIASGLAVCGKAPEKDKIDVIFKFVDLDDDNIITKDEIAVLSVVSLGSQNSPKMVAAVEENPLVAQIVGMGFSRLKVNKAIRETNNGSKGDGNHIENIVSWILNNQNQSQEDEIDIDDTPKQQSKPDPKTIDDLTIGLHISTILSTFESLFTTLDKENSGKINLKTFKKWATQSKKPTELDGLLKPMAALYDRALKWKQSELKTSNEQLERSHSHKEMFVDKNQNQNSTTNQNNPKELKRYSSVAVMESSKNPPPKGERAEIKKELKRESSSTKTTPIKKIPEEVEEESESTTTTTTTTVATTTTPQNNSAETSTPKKTNQSLASSSSSFGSDSEDEVIKPAIQVVIRDKPIESIETQKENTLFSIYNSVGISKPERSSTLRARGTRTFRNTMEPDFFSNLQPLTPTAGSTISTSSTTISPPPTTSTTAATTTTTSPSTPNQSFTLANSSNVPPPKDYSSSRGDMTDTASSNSSPPTPLSQKINSEGIDLMKKCVSKLENGQFLESIQDLDQCIKTLLSLHSSNPQIIQGEINFCVGYRVALNLLSTIKEIEKKIQDESDNDIKTDYYERIALLSKFLVDIPIQINHRIVCARMAIKYNLLSKNFGIASKFIEILLQKGVSDKDSLESKLLVCKENSNSNNSLPMYICPTCRSTSGVDQVKCSSCSRPIRWCFQTFEIIKDLTFLQCNYCNSTFSINQSEVIPKSTCPCYNQESGTTLGLNVFSDLTHDEFISMFNLNQGIGSEFSDDEPDYDEEILELNKFPKYVDLRETGCISPIRDQGHCGSCFTFAAIDVVEFQNYNVMEIRMYQTCFQYMKDYGINTLESYPYKAKYSGQCHFKSENIGARLSGHVEINKKNRTAMVEALTNGISIAISFDAGQRSLQFYRDGVYDDPNCRVYPGHAVPIIGYGFDVDSQKNYWLLKNSWSPYFGSNGFFKIARGKNRCGVEKWPAYPIAQFEAYNLQYEPTNVFIADGEDFLDLTFKWKGLREGMTRIYFPSPNTYNVTIKSLSPECSCNGVKGARLECMFNNETIFQQECQFQFSAKNIKCDPTRHAFQFDVDQNPSNSFYPFYQKTIVVPCIILEIVSVTPAPTNGGVIQINFTVPLDDKPKLVIDGKNLDAMNSIYPTPSIMVVVPPGKGNGHTITATIQHKTVNSTFSYGKPFFEKLIPNPPTNGLDKVTIQGGNFYTDPSLINVNLFELGSCANISIVEPHSSISCNFPPGSSINYLQISVDKVVGEKQVFNYQEPIVTNVLPLPNGGGYVTIYGENFGFLDSKPIVTIDNTQCSNCKVYSPHTEIHCMLSLPPPYHTQFDSNYTIQVEIDKVIGENYSLVQLYKVYPYSFKEEKILETAESGIEDSIYIKLSYPPYSNVVIDFKTSDESIAVVNTGQTLYFNQNNWNHYQKISVGGISNGRNDQGPYLSFQVIGTPRPGSPSIFEPLSLGGRLKKSIWPWVIGTSPSITPPGGGVELLLLGRNFINGLEIRVDSVKVSNYTFINSTVLKFITPKIDKTGYVSVVVTNPDGGYNGCPSFGPGLHASTLHLQSSNSSNYNNNLLGHQVAEVTSLMSCDLMNQLYYTSDCQLKGYYGVTDCKPCPVGGICPGGNRIWTVPGYWNKDEKSIPHECKPASACLGNINGTKSRSLCSEGYESDYCSTCSDDFYRLDEMCVSCLNQPSDYRVIVSVVIIFFIIVFLSIILLHDKHLDTIVSILLSAQQLVQIGINASKHFNSGLQHFFNVLSAVLFDYRFLNPGCSIGSVTFFHVFAGTILVVVIISILFIFAAFFRSVFFYSISTKTGKNRKTIWIEDLTKEILQQQEKLSLNQLQTTTASSPEEYERNLSKIKFKLATRIKVELIGLLLGKKYLKNISRTLKRCRTSTIEYYHKSASKISLGSASSEKDSLDIPYPGGGNGGEKELSYSMMIKMKITKKTWWMAFKKRTIRSLIILATLVYFIITIRSLQAVNCIQLPDGWFLNAQLSIKCYSGSHNAVAAIGYFLLIFYTLGFPLICSYLVFLVWRIRSKSNIENNNNEYDENGQKIGEYSEKYGFLYRGVRQDVIWFRLPLFLINFFVACQYVFNMGRRVILKPFKFFNYNNDNIRLPNSTSTSSTTSSSSNSSGSSNSNSNGEEKNIKINIDQSSSNNNNNNSNSNNNNNTNNETTNTTIDGDLYKDKEITFYLSQAFSYLGISNTILNYLLLNNNAFHKQQQQLILQQQQQKLNISPKLSSQQNTPVVSPTLKPISLNDSNNNNNNNSKVLLPVKLDKTILDDLEYQFDQNYQKETILFANRLSSIDSIDQKKRLYLDFISDLTNRSLSLCPHKHSHLLSSPNYYLTIRESVEYYVTLNVFHYIFPIDYDQDLILWNRIESLSFIEPIHLGLDQFEYNQQLDPICKSLLKINAYQTSTEKQRSNPPNLWSNYKYLEYYVDQERQHSVYDYFFITFSMAIKFIEKLDHTHLSIDSTYFQMKIEEYNKRQESSTIIINQSKFISNNTDNSNNNNNNINIQESIDNSTTTSSSSSTSTTSTTTSTIQITEDEKRYQQFLEINRIPSIVEKCKNQLNENQLEELLLKFISISLINQKPSYHSLIRYSLKRFFIYYLGIKPNTFLSTEMTIIGTLQDNPENSLDLLPSHKTNNMSTSDKAIKTVKIAGAAVTGAVIVGLTGGLAAPFIGSVLSMVGAGSIMTGIAATTGISGTTMLGVIFGAAGAKVSAEKMISATSGVKDYAIHRIKTQTSLHAVIAVYGFGSDDQQQQQQQSEGKQILTTSQTWDNIIRQVTDDYGDIFLVEFEKEIMLKLKSIIAEYQKTIVQSIVRSAATNIISQSLAHALVPLSILKAASVLDNPWTLLKDRSEKAGKILAQQILDGYFGNRPLTLIGTGMGSRLIFYALEELARQSPQNPIGYSLIEMVIFIGSPIPSDTKRWSKIIELISGRVINCYSPNDMVLKYVCRSANCLSDGLLPAAGVVPIHIPSSSLVIENVDVSNLVKSHLDYEKVEILTKIFDHIGINSINYCRPKVSSLFSGIVHNV
eukprot:gene4264-5336_t